LGSEADERAVLSICAARTPGGPWILVHGALLVVPEACAASSWPDWRRSNGNRFATEFDPPLPDSLVATGDTWLLGRAPLELAEADAWIQELQAGATEGPRDLPAAGQCPAITATLERPQAVLRVVPGVDTRPPRSFPPSAAPRRGCSGTGATT
jgi:hypothetical protein